MPAPARPAAAGHDGSRPASAGASGRAAKSSPLTWGLLAGAALVGLVALGIGAVVVFGLVFKQFQPADPSLTVPVLTTQAPGGGTTMQDATPTEPGEVVETVEALPSSTPFSTVEKPADIPVMPGGENLQIFEMTPAQGSMSKIITIMFETDASVDEITAYYEAEMPANGWEKVNTYTDGKSLVITFQKGERVAQVMVTQVSGRNSVAVNVMEQ
jgi:hypothetical protein